MKPAYRNRHLIKRKLQEILSHAAPLRPSDEHYNINVTLSDKTSMDRLIRDTRPEICKSLTYDVKTLPTVAVVIPFFNEALSMLIRTVHSILNRSPDMLLDEVDLFFSQVIFIYFCFHPCLLRLFWLMTRVLNNGLKIHFQSIWLYYQK